MNVIWQVLVLTLECEDWQIINIATFRVKQGYGEQKYSSNDS